MPNPATSQTEFLHTRNFAAALVISVAFFFAAVCCTYAQHIDIPPIRSDGFVLTQPQLRVSLQQVHSDNDYMIGVQVNNNLRQSGSIEIGDFVTSPSANGRYRQFQRFDAVGREKVLIGNNTITVLGLDEYRGNLLVLLTVPPATRVAISVNGKTEFAGTPLKGTILHHGQMVATEFLGRHQLFSRLLFPEIDTPQLEMVKTKNGYLWSQEALNKHLISFNKPPNHPELINGDLEIVTIAVKIDPNGNLVLAKALTGREPFVTEAVNAVSQARFSPFIVNGSAVDASGDVTVVFSKDGCVSSTLKQ